MIRSGVRWAILCIAAAGWGPRALLGAEAALPQSPIRFESDTLEYREGDQVIVASGNVQVRQGSYTFLSDNALFNIPGKNMDAWGLVRFMDAQGNEIRSKSLSYDAGDGSAKLVDAEGSFGPWLFATKRVERDREGNFLLERARLSTCETDLSKFHLYGYRIRILPKKRLTVQHALFRLGPLPILYLPYYYYSLGEKHLAFQIFPGQNNSEGAFVRTVWGYPFTDETYVKVYLDELTKRGHGTGGEFNYYFGDRAKGSLYGFRIEDRLTDKTRWNARLAHWQRLSPDWILQSNANRMSDDSFPNDFFREDFNRVARDLRSQAALTYQRKSVYFRLLGERSDLFDPAAQTFHPGEELGPRMEASQVQTPLRFWGFEKTLSLSLTRRFAGTSPNRFALRPPGAFETVLSTPVALSRNYRAESDAQVSVLNRFRILPKTTFIPKVTVKNYWTDKPQGGEPSEKFVQRLETESTLRQGIGRSLDLDLTYLYNQRLQDNRSDDQGRENHELRFLSWFRPDHRFSFRFDTAHVLPIFKGEPVAFLNRGNYRPLRGEFSLTPSGFWEFFFREEYQLSDPSGGRPHVLSTQSELVLGERALGRDYFLIGTSYFSARDNAYEVRQSARISPWKNWKFEGTLRTLLSYRNANMFYVTQGELTEKEVLARTSWRCWDISFVFRERRGVVEFLFNLELQLERQEREKNSKAAQESEWYPWRGMQ